MSSHLIRIGFAAIVVTTFATALVVAQGQPVGPAKPAGIPVFNPIEGRIVVLTSRPEGSRVEKGHVVCELDAGELRDRLANQEIVIRAATSELHSQRIARAVAVMSEIEYKNSEFRQRLAGIQAEVKLTESKLSRAEDQTEWSRRMFQKGYVSLSEKNANELMLQQARFELEQALASKSALVDHSMDRAIKLLSAEVESARAREARADAALERERSLQKRLTAQVDQCKVVAPVAGRIEYAGLIAPGAVVRDGEVIFRVVPDAVPGAKAK